jgi:N-acetylglutamate synthase-like GNAT family acetyltransferase
MKTLIRQARAADERAIRLLVKRADLPFEDVEVGRQTFLIATDEGRVVGTVGLESYGEHGCSARWPSTRDCVAVAWEASLRESWSRSSIAGHA